jgi:putative alpha-1,2-mannosidase
MPQDVPVAASESCYEDDSILGFSHTHFSGAGHSDLGDVLLMPTAREVKLEPGYPERAEPGYYAVKLLDNGVDVELTASARVGLHRLMNREEGVEYRGFAAPGKTPADQILVEGKALEGTFGFGTPADGTVLVKVAVSGVTEDGALANLAAMPGWDFDAERRRAHGAWEDTLRAVDIDAPQPMKRMAYTSLYHALLAPQPVHGRGWHIPRSGLPGAPGAGLPLPRHPLPVGHVPRPASAADADPAGETQRRLRALAGRIAESQPVRHPARVAVRRP